MSRNQEALQQSVDSGSDSYALSNEILAQAGNRRDSHPPFFYTPYGAIIPLVQALIAIIHSESELSRFIFVVLVLVVAHTTNRFRFRSPAENRNRAEQSRAEQRTAGGVTSLARDGDGAHNAAWAGQVKQRV